MTLNEYITKLQNLVNEDEANGELQVYSAIDDEGNGFAKIHYSPSVCFTLSQYSNNHIIDGLVDPDDVGDFDEDELHKVVIVN